MKLMVPLRLIFLLLLSQSFAIAFGEENQRARPEGQSIIKGRVIVRGSRSPVRRVSVSLFSDLNRRVVKSTVTNNRGEFVLDQVAAGTYILTAMGPGIKSPLQAFEISAFGQGQRADDSNRVSITVDGKEQKSADLNVTRGATIKGQILFHDREPLVAARILLYRKVGDTVAPFMVLKTPIESFLVPPVVTDDRGNYRIDGLPAGEYFVGVSEMQSGGGQFTAGDMRGVVSVYYPGVTEFGDAQSIKVPDDSVVRDIDVVLADTVDHRLSGVVKWRKSGQVIEGAPIMLQRKTGPRVQTSLSEVMNNTRDPETDSVDRMFKSTTLITLMSNEIATAESDQDGRWHFSDLGPATYIVSVFVPTSAKDKASLQKHNEDLVNAENYKPDTLIHRQIEVTLTEDAPKEVVLDIGTGGRILGSLSTEGDETIAGGVSIKLEPVDRPPDFLNLPHLIESGGPFEIEGAPEGLVRLNLELHKEDGRYVKSVTREGRDLLREPLKVIDGVDTSGVRIELAVGRAKLSGAVLSRDDRARMGGSGILLVAADPSLWQSSTFRTFERAKSNGDYSLMCAPGEYLLFTWRAGDPPLQSVESFIRGNAASALRIVVGKSEERKLDLFVR